MSAIDLSTEAPASIASAEQAVAWLGLLLFDLNKGKTYKEANGNSIDSGLAPLVDISFVTTADGTQRMIARFSLELDPAFVTDTSQKLWHFVQPLSDALVPAVFKVD